MPHLVFIHGPGAGACPEAFIHQLQYFTDSLAPALPGHPEGSPCTKVRDYANWLRGWLWAREYRDSLVLAGYTLGACIALQYALDYPEEVKGLVLMSVGMRPRPRTAASLELRQRAARDADAHQEWMEAMTHSMQFIDPQLRERLLASQRKIGPTVQYQDLKVIDRFEAQERIRTLKPPLLVIRGADDPVRATDPTNYEKEIHAAVPGSRYLEIPQAGHFPMAERPAEVNRATEEFIASLG